MPNVMLAICKYKKLLILITMVMVDTLVQNTIRPEAQTRHAFKNIVPISMI